MAIYERAVEVLGHVAVGRPGRSRLTVDEMARRASLGRWVEMRILFVFCGFLYRA